MLYIEREELMHCGFKIEERKGIALLFAVDRQSQILGHLLVYFNDLNTSAFQILTELSQLGVVVQLGTMSQTTSPGKDGSNWVGRSGVTLMKQDRY